MIFGQNGGGNSFFLKMLEDFDNSVQNKTSKYIEMCVLLVWTLYPGDSTGFRFKICEEKNLHYCEALPTVYPFFTLIN